MATVHTYPGEDLIEHIRVGTECPCGPTVEAVFDNGRLSGWHVIHHSLDGREQHEGTADD